MSDLDPDLEDLQAQNTKARRAVLRLRSELVAIQDQRVLLAAAIALQDVSRGLQARAYSRFPLGATEGEPPPTFPPGLDGDFSPEERERLIRAARRVAVVMMEHPGPVGLEEWRDRVMLWLSRDESSSD